MKIEVRARRIAFEIELERRAAARVRLVPARFCLQRHRHDGMILIIFTDTVELMDDGDAVPLELGARADAREHENLRRMINSGTEHDLVGCRGVFVVVFSIANACGFFIAENYRRDWRCAEDREVCSLSRRAEISN